MTPVKIVTVGKQEKMTQVKKQEKNNFIEIFAKKVDFE